MADIGVIGFTTTDLAERKTEAANKLTEVKAELELDPNNDWLNSLKEVIEKWQSDNA
tara:strand:+ start:6701 stop:6871 length:171 start_codon:yes stop_codon:yes gene_type:complete